MSQLIDEQIEENVRFCEELLKRNPEFVPVEEEWGSDAAEPAIVAEPPLSFEPVAVIPAASGSDLKKEKPEQSEKRSVFKTAVSLLICSAIAMVLGILITKFVANHTMVDGSSMEPALQNGDNLIVEKISYLAGDPERFDIVVFKQNEDTRYIKRVVGLPGERIKIENKKIYINGKPLYDAFGDGDMDDAGIASKELSLGQDEYFVLGDNRDGSEDSRSEKVGPVKSGQIEGRAWFRITPLKHFGVLE